MQAEIQPVGRCRVCGSRELEFLFSLGDFYVSDFVSEDRVLSGPRYPIETELCRECGLIQLRHTAPQDFLYSRHYWFVSGITRTNRDALADVAHAAERLAGLKAGDVVLDIGSNDSTLLRSYATPGIVKVGVEPAKNLAGEGAKGVDVFVPEFWSYEAYLKEMWRRRPDDPKRNSNHAKVITACGMFYDLDRPGDFIRDVARALAPGGVFVAQLMCAKQTVEQDDVGNYVMEHLEFYTLKSLFRLLGDAGLEIFDIEENVVNGGSYRLYARHTTPEHRPSPALVAACRREREMRLGDPETWRGHFARMCANRDRCVECLREEKALGRRIHVLGASSKGSVIAQFYGLDSSIVEAASERDPAKWGTRTTGTGVRCVSEAESRAMRPDIYVVYPYAFKDEIIRRERDFLVGGGRLIFPLPAANVVAADPADLARRGEWEPPGRMPMLVCEVLQ